MVQTAGFNQWAEAIQMVLVCLIGVQTVFASRMQTHNTLIPVGFISIALGPPHAPPPRRLPFPDTATTTTVTLQASPARSLRMRASPCFSEADFRSCSS